MTSDDLNVQGASTETTIDGNLDRSHSSEQLLLVEQLEVPAAAAELLDKADIAHVDCTDAIPIKKLGYGGSANVYRARLHGQLVAIKVLETEEITPERLEAFAQEIVFQVEAETAPRVRGEDLAHACLVMRTVCNRSIRDELRDCTLQSHYDRVVAVGKSAEAVAGATAAGIVHRDVKPTNLLRGVGELDRVYLADFGLAAYQGIDITGGPVRCSFKYSAPEQVHDMERVTTVQTDIYALGATMFAILHSEHKTLADLAGCEKLRDYMNMVSTNRDYDENIAALARQYGEVAGRIIVAVLHGCFPTKPQSRWNIVAVQQACADLLQKV